MNVHVCCRPQSQVNYHGTKGERQALYCGPWYEAKESVRRQMALGNQAQPLIGSWSSLQLSQESRVLMQCVAASVKIWWLNGQILPRFVDWEPFLFTLFIHSVNMNNLPVSSFLFFFCQRRIIIVCGRLKLRDFLRLALLYCIDSRQLLSGSSLSLFAESSQSLLSQHNRLSYTRARLEKSPLLNIFILTTCFWQL